MLGMLSSVCDLDEKIVKLEEQVYKKYAKKFYRDKPTKVTKNI